MAKIVFHTIQNPPVIGGEVSKLPSETRQSDNMDIKETIARFFRQGGVIPQQLDATSLAAEEKEQMFESMTEQDLMDADLVEQKNFVDEVQGTLNQPPKESEEQSAEKDNSAEKVEPTESAKAD